MLPQFVSAQSMGRYDFWDYAGGLAEVAAIRHSCGVSEDDEAEYFATPTVRRLRRWELFSWNCSRYLADAGSILTAFTPYFSLKQPG